MSVCLDVNSVGRFLVLDLRSWMRVKLEMASCNSLGLIYITVLYFFFNFFYFFLNFYFLFYFFFIFPPVNISSSVMFCWRSFFFGRQYFAPSLRTNFFGKSFMELICDQWIWNLCIEAQTKTVIYIRPKLLQLAISSYYYFYENRTQSTVNKSIKQLTN